MPTLTHSDMNTSQPLHGPSLPPPSHAELFSSSFAQLNSSVLSPGSVPSKASQLSPEIIPASLSPVVVPNHLSLLSSPHPLQKSIPFPKGSPSINPKMAHITAQLA